MTRDTLGQRLRRLDQSEVEQFFDAIANTTLPQTQPEDLTRAQHARKYLDNLAKEGRNYTPENEKRLTQMFKIHLFPTLHESLDSRKEIALPERYHEETTDREHYALEGGWHALCIPDTNGKIGYDPAKFEHAPIEEVAGHLMKRGTQFWKKQNEELGYIGDFNPRLGHSKKDIDKLSDRFHWRQIIKNERDPEKLAHTLSLIKSSEHEHFPLESRINDIANTLDINPGTIEYINREFGPEIGEYFR